MGLKIGLVNTIIQEIPLSEFDLTLSELRIMNHARILQVEKSMQLHGQLQPVVVRVYHGGYQLIDGFKRYYGKNGHIDHPLPVLKDHPSPGGKTTP